MDTSLSDLEKKISDLVVVVNKLREDNVSLQKQLSAKDQENKQLKEKIKKAKIQLEKLVDQLPEK